MNNFIEISCSDCFFPRLRKACLNCELIACLIYRYFQMQDLELKLSNEMKPDCTVVACRFPFPKWKEIATIGEGVDCVWIYKPK